ncbi:hypothetical protein Bpfe_003618 [Biomphalaria pfeifferi]|uniref:Uncharacterized protein n=1 Tax=Biomphalaria pfeifferi TaxID=112525 RepID=A0AAD8C646_BIOPF|nr:hypothetical protein Bpfe_003618 [Biomphalaria pfeifferi]
MYMNKLATIFLIIVLGVKTDHITLKQIHPINKTEAIIHNVDYFVFNSEIQVTGLTSVLSVISMEIKANTSYKFQTICDINVDICDIQEEKNCVCRYCSADNKYFILVNITAKVMYSGGTVRGVLIFKDDRIVSNNISLPVIFDTPGDVSLFIDAQKISDLNQCNETTSKDMAILVYFCASALSYKLEIVDDNQNSSYGSNVVIHTLNTTSQRSVTFYQKDLVSNVVLRRFECTVHAASGLESCPQEEEKSCTIYIAPICILSILIVLISFCFIYWYKCRRCS